MTFARTLSFYFAKRFMLAVVGVFVGVFFLVGIIDYIEMTRRVGDMPNVSSFTAAQISFFRLPLMLERLMPFCVLIGAMTCYLSLSRRLELVIARAAGMSAWQFVAPAVISALLFGIFATVIYNPVSAFLQERSRKLEAEIFQNTQSAIQHTTGGFWVRQRSVNGEAVINARASSDKGRQLVRHHHLHLRYRRQVPRPHRGEIRAAAAGRMEARRRARLRRQYAAGRSRLVLASDQSDARAGAARASPRRKLSRSGNSPPISSSPSMPDWPLPPTGCSTRSFSRARFSSWRWCSLPPRSACDFSASVACKKWFWVASPQGFLLYVLAKITEDLSKAELMHPMVAAWLPAIIGGSGWVFGVVVPGGWVMAGAVSARPIRMRRRVLRAALPRLAQPRR